MGRELEVLCKKCKKHKTTHKTDICLRCRSEHKCKCGRGIVGEYTMCSTCRNGTAGHTKASKQAARQMLFNA